MIKIKNIQRIAVAVLDLDAAVEKYKKLFGIVPFNYGIAKSEKYHWVAFELLGLIGGKMLWDAFSRKEKKWVSDPTRGLMLVVLSVATSIDALAVGLSIALLQVSVWTPAVIIGVVAAILTVIGLQFGSRLAARWRRLAELAGGVILWLIGIRILVSHLIE